MELKCWGTGNQRVLLRVLLRCSLKHFAITRALAPIICMSQWFCLVLCNGFFAHWRRVINPKRFCFFFKNIWHFLIFFFFFTEYHLINFWSTSVTHTWRFFRKQRMERLRISAQYRVRILQSRKNICRLFWLASLLVSLWLVRGELSVDRPNTTNSSWQDSLQKQPFLLAPRRLVRFARRDVWWRKICPESGRVLWLIDVVVILF